MIEPECQRMPLTLACSSIVMKAMEAWDSNPRNRGASERPAIRVIGFTVRQLRGVTGRGRGEQNMDERPKKEQLVIFDSRPVGEAVNPHVIRIAPQCGPDYASIQRSIRESAEFVSAKKSSED
jgi:hypothetical protein